VEGRDALHGAVVMGVSFGLAAIVPVIPYLLLPVGTALWASIGLSAAVLFTIGVVKSRWTRHGAIRSGLEIVVLAAFAGVAGYFFGSMLPTLLGVRVPGA